MAGNVTAQNTSLSGGSALTLQHSIPHGATALHWSPSSAVGQAMLMTTSSSS